MHSMVRLLVAAIIVTILMLFCSCGGTSAPAAQQPSTSSATLPIVVTVSPPGISLGASQTQQFTATVINTTNTAVTWTLSCTAADCGTISSSGLYRAPSVVTNGITITVTAVSQAAPTKTATASVSFVALAISISPVSAMTLAAGATQTFTATISNHSNQDITWSVSGVGCIGSDCGSLTNASAQSVTYTAPPTITTAATAMVTATSVADNTKSKSAKINLMPMSQPLNGRYAFLFRSADSSTVFAASLVADGKANLSGVGDVINASGLQTHSAFTGTYVLGADRRGAMQLTGAGLTFNLRMVAVTGNFGRLIDFSGAANGHGWFEKQNETAFSPAMTGENFEFALGGINGSAPTSRVGGLGWDSSGNGDLWAWNWYSFFVGCTIDSTSGRGTLVTNNPQDVMYSTAPWFAFYTVDAARALMLGDTRHPLVRLSGSMDASGGFELRGGDYTYSMITPNSLSAGRFTAKSAGGSVLADITGVQDEVRDGAANLDVPVSGQIVDLGFDWVFTLGIGGTTLREVGFATPHGKLLFEAGDGSYGEAFLQKDGPFSASAITGDYSLQFFGRSMHAVGAATLAPPNITGVLDVSHNGLATDLPLTGTLSFVSGDRANLTLSTSVTGPLPFRAYVVSPRKLLLVSTMPGQVTMGWAEKIE